MQPTRLLRPWDSPDKSTGVGCHFLLQLKDDYHKISLNIYCKIGVLETNSFCFCLKKYFFTFIFLFEMKETLNSIMCYNFQKFYIYDFI